MEEIICAECNGEGTLNIVERCPLCMGSGVKQIDATTTEAVIRRIVGELVLEVGV